MDDIERFFVDDLQLTQQQRKDLFDALLSAFPLSHELERMVAFGLNTRLALIMPPDDNLQNKVFNLILWAEAQGRLSELISAAQQANPGNPRLQEWLRANLPQDTLTAGAIAHSVASGSGTAQALSPALLRERITDGLSRSEVGVLWYDVLGGQMDDEMPGRSQSDCVIELLARVGRRNRMSELVAALRRLYPHISLSAE